VVYRPARMSPDTLMAGYERARREFYSPGHILERMAKSRTGLWWNVPRNLGYMMGAAGSSSERTAGSPSPREPVRGQALAGQANGVRASRRLNGTPTAGDR
jgi:hypothetical protein